MTAAIPGQPPADGFQHFEAIHVAAQIQIHDSHVEGSIAQQIQRFLPAGGRHHDVAHPFQGLVRKYRILSSSSTIKARISSAI
jgi:hypothetical protein